VRTYPIRSSETAPPFALEVDIALISPATLARLLSSLSAVTSIAKASPKSGSPDVRLTFEYQQVPFVVWEPFGDNSRYWIGPVDPQDGAKDVTAIISALEQHTPSPFRRAIAVALSIF